MDQMVTAQLEQTHEAPGIEAPVAVEMPSTTLEPAQTVGGEQLPEGTRAADGKVQILSQAVFKRLKDEAREKGRKLAMTEYEQRAKQLGFETVEEMFMAAQLMRQQPPKAQAQQPLKRQATPPQLALDDDEDNGSSLEAQPEPAPTPGKGRKEWLEKERALRAQYQQRLLEKERLTRKLQRDLDAKDAEMILRQAAVMAGATDVDYVVNGCLAKHTAGMTPKELADFDEAIYFAKLKVEKPYLFGERVIPATTGAGTASEPPAPKPGQVTTAHAQNGKTDVRKMDQKQYDEYLRRRGINPTAF